MHLNRKKIQKFQIYVVNYICGKFILTQIHTGIAHDSESNIAVFFVCCWDFVLWTSDPIIPLFVSAEMSCSWELLANLLHKPFSFSVCPCRLVCIYNIWTRSRSLTYQIPGQKRRRYLHNTAKDQNFPLCRCEEKNFAVSFAPGRGSVFQTLGTHLEKGVVPEVYTITSILEMSNHISLSKTQIKLVSKNTNCKWDCFI